MDQFLNDDNDVSQSASQQNYQLTENSFDDYDKDTLRINDRRKNNKEQAAIYEEEIGRIRYVLNKEGFSKNEINNIFNNELPNNNELRRELCKKALTMGWKSDYEHLDFDKLINLEQNSDNETQTDEIKPPEGLFIPSQEFIMQNIPKPTHVPKKDNLMDTSEIY
jgi:hypothetical protein